MPVFYIKDVSTDDVKKFFSVLPAEKQPRVVSDKDYPGAWDKTTSDGITIIATDEPRADTDIKELSIEGRQAEDLIQELQPEGIEGQPESTVVPDAVEEEKPTEGYRTYRDRGFKVGALL